jgi:23S rRNA (guanine2445-N2)-methyltransferase / 23S rRNA (guanine2069-N7)-methyltransferase
MFNHYYNLNLEWKLMLDKTFFATCPKNLEGLLETELLALGAKETKQTLAGVKFKGDLALAYRACLWSRLANRILLPLTECRADSAEKLYKGVRSIKWLEHMRAEDTFVVDFSGVSPAITNSHFGALKVKDAIVDQIRDQTGQRPSIDKEKPSLRVNVYLQHDLATISIDLSGESLHRRFYRTDSGEAPIKENLAAAILYRAGWPDLVRQGKVLLDPMCGSGTILIEAALIAADIAPALMRRTFGFTHWLQHQDKIWQEILLDAQARRVAGLEKLTTEIRGYDIDPRVIAIARRNIVRAGLEDKVKVLVKELDKFTPPTHHGQQVGVIVTNPPYGERLSEVQALMPLYKSFGTILRERFLGWQVAMITSNPDLGKTMGLRAMKQYSFFNGALPCKLLLLQVSEEWFVNAPHPASIAPI